MRFGIDLDGVVADYIPPFIRELSKIYSGIPEDFEPNTWNWYKEFGITKDQWNILCAEIWNKEGFWLTISPYPEISKILREYIKDNPKTEFYYITSRPQLVYHSMLLTCRQWLEANGLYGYNTSVIITTKSHDKPAVYKACKIDKAIDDNLDVAIAAKHVCWLMLRKWNGFDYMNDQEYSNTQLNVIATPKDFKEKWLIG